MPALTWKDQLGIILEEHDPSEVLGELAKEAAHYGRFEPKMRENWARVRTMMLKAAAVAEDVGL